MKIEIIFKRNKNATCQTEKVEAEAGTELKVEMEEEGGSRGGCLLQVAHLAAPHRGVFKSRSASNAALLPQARQMSAA